MPAGLTGWRPGPTVEQRLRAAIDEAGFSLRGFCLAARVHHRRIYRIANGEADPSGLTALRILEALDADWHHVWRLEARPSREALEGWEVSPCGRWQGRYRAALEGRGWSAIHASARMGVAEESVRHWIKRAHVPGLRGLVRASQALGIHPSDIFRAAGA